jgi:hypothetical protein
MTIDGYCHCGISKHQPVDVVLRVMNKHAVDRAVLCQHLGQYDRSYLAEVVKDHPGRFAAVCLIDPTAGTLFPLVADSRRTWGCAWCFMLPTVWLALFRRFAGCCKTEATS